MGAISPESWPILAAFLVLQGAITWPLVKYIRQLHEAQIADLKARADRFEQLAIGNLHIATRVTDVVADRAKEGQA